ncbi:helix-turn-helix domain-containing protein [Pseudonocardia yuanmonensis]
MDRAARERELWRGIEAVHAVAHFAPEPADDLARLWHAATVLREYRGDGHGPVTPRGREARAVIEHCTDDAAAPVALR